MPHTWWPVFSFTMINSCCTTPQTWVTLDLQMSCLTAFVLLSHWRGGVIWIWLRGQETRRANYGLASCWESKAPYISMKCYSLLCLCWCVAAFTFAPTEHRDVSLGLSSQQSEAHQGGGRVPTPCRLLYFILSLHSTKERLYIALQHHF